MARLPTFERNFSDLKNLTLADLKRLGYMQQGYLRSGTIRWSRRGEVTGTIGVTVRLLQTGGFMELNYTYNSQDQMKYNIQLVQMPSNLGKGQVWYFICPLTGERCRTLYQTGKYFASRKAQPATLYESQTHSKHYRWIDKTFGPELKLDNLYDEVYKRYAKKHYRGKPTPKVMKVLKMERAYDLAKRREPKSFDEYFTDNFRKPSTNPSTI